MEDIKIIFFKYHQFFAVESWDSIFLIQTFMAKDVT